MAYALRQCLKGRDEVGTHYKGSGAEGAWPLLFHKGQALATSCFQQMPNPMRQCWQHFQHFFLKTGSVSLCSLRSPWGSASRLAFRDTGHPDRVEPLTPVPNMGPGQTAQEKEKYGVGWSLSPPLEAQRGQATFLSPHSCRGQPHAESWHS